MKIKIWEKVKKWFGRGKKESWGKKQLKAMAKLGGKMVVM